jgi:hypothetical protein
MPGMKDPHLEEVNRDPFESCYDDHKCEIMLFKSVLPIQCWMKLCILFENQKQLRI